MQTCLKCKRPAELEGFCNIHYWHNKWLDNRDPENLGIVLFAKMIVPEWVRNETPEFHHKMYYEYTKLYAPSKKDKYDRLLAEIGFRGSAKTTRAKIILLYVCCFGLEKFVVYCSQTNTFAVQDVFEVRRELSSNPRIRYYFGIISSKGVRGQDGEWSRDAFLTSTGTYVFARGVGQQIRSALRNSYRPTLSIVNDMYSRESVKTEMGRADGAKWFFEEMFNAVDDLEGKVYFNGTILHEDTVPVTLQHNTQWRVFEFPVMDIDDFHKALDHCKITDRTVELPPPDEIARIEKQSKLLWQKRLSLEYILKKYKEAYESNQTAGFYQEYFHVIVPPGEKSFKNVRFCQIDFFKRGAVNWISVDYGGGSKVIYNVNVSFGVDPASGTSQASKYSAIVYVACNSDRQIFVLGYSRGKFGFRDEFRPEFQKSQADTVDLDRSHLLRVGLVDEEIRLTKQYRPICAKVETTQQQQSVYDEIIRLMRVNDAFHQVFSEKPTTEKTERDADILMPYFQTGSIFLNTGLSDLELQMKSFPKGTTVDIIDALAYAVSCARPPSKVEFEEYTKSTLRKNQDDFTHEFVVL